MAKMNSVVVLSGYLTPDRKMDDESERRVDKGIELLRNGYVEFIVMNGGSGRFTEEVDGSIYVPRGTHPVHCEVMRDYALDIGVPPELIFVQDFSCDTIGEAYFVKEMHLAPRLWRRNVVVSSLYHLVRAGEIYRHILGPDFETELEGVETEKDNKPEIMSQEELLLAMFLQQAKGTQPGDSRAIERMLYEIHPLYSRIPEKERLRFRR